jgi:signal transduction histidine kinase
MLASAKDVHDTPAARIQDELVRTTAFAANQQANLILQAEGILEDLGDGPWLDSLNADGCTDRARSLLRATPGFVNVGAVDLEGNVFCSGVPLTEPVRVSERRYFQRALEEGRFVSGEALIGRITGQPSATFARPLPEDGPPRAVAFASIDLSWPERFALQERLPPNTTLTAFDPAGSIMGRYPNGLAWIGKFQGDAPLIQTVISRGAGVTEETGLDGERRLYAFMPIPRVPDGASGHLALGYDPDVVFGEVDRILLRGLGAMAVVAALVLAGAWLFASRLILEPVHAVVEAAGRLAGGERSARTVGPYAQGELGALQHAFDDMASALQHNEERITQMEKMEVIGQLAGGIAHDFNNLLTAVIGFGQMLEDDVGDVEPQRTYLAEIVRAGERATALTGQLLAFSRKAPVRSELVDLNQTVTHMENLLARVLGEDVRVAISLAPNLGLVRADPSQMEQIVLNLAANARDAMPTGGQLTIETGEVELDAVAAATHPGARAGRHVMLAVTDTGVGMNRETQARIFEPFFTTKPVGKGTGLGLATVFGIVQQAGGSIWVYSEPSHGTTFRIYLPLASPVGEASPSPEETGPLIAGSGRILLVEDEAAVRLLARTVLTSCGYQVLEASNAEQAMDIARHFTKPVDLVLTDLVLPGRSGRQLAETLVATRLARRVLYMSGFTDDTVIRHGLLQGEIMLLEKPFTPHALAAKVAAAMAT